MASGSDGSGKKRRLASYGKSKASSRKVTKYTSNKSSANYTPF